MKRFLFMAAALLLAACARGPVQQDPASTVVNEDGTVTFNYRNDNAASVQVDVQFAGRHDMQKDSLTGLWSLTLGPAVPDMYPYCFVVDGVSIMDAQNLQYFPNEGFKNSLLDIPGKDAPLIHAVQDVPHGKVDYVNYFSTTLNCYNTALVYTPASYGQGDKSYPVFYLISGTTDTEEVYYKVGRMNVIADNLAAQGKAEEMIIVLPYGNPSKIRPRQASGFGFMMGDLFSNDLINDLMPYVEANYRTINDAAHRAIGGFSRGGNQALSNGLQHLDKFSYLCSYSSFTSTDLPGVYDQAEDTNSKIKLFWLGIGVDDMLYRTSHDYVEFLLQKGIRCTLEFTEGKFGHTWMNARYFLDKTLPLLFNEEASAQAMAQGGMPLPALKGDEQPFTGRTMALMFPRQVTSPEFSGQSVTFRIRADKAKEVFLEGEMLAEPAAMTNHDGVWEITLSDLTPDVYCYNFVVDGMQVMDATNMYLAPEIGFKRSILEIPGAPYGLNDVTGIAYAPVQVQYQADGTPFATVTPAEGDAGAMKTVVLLSGKKATFQVWQQVAHAQQMLCQMMAAGQCKPCILKMYTGSQCPEQADVILNADKYTSWTAARKALEETLKKL